MPRDVSLARLFVSISLLGAATISFAADDATTAGEKIYVDHCSVCHSIGGPQSFGPDLTGVSKRPRFATQGSPQLSELILRGEGRMPAIPLSDPDLRQLLAYLESV